jgi:hypothetical protein
MSAVFVHGVSVHPIGNKPAFHMERRWSRMGSRQSGRGAARGIGLDFLCGLKN